MLAGLKRRLIKYVSKVYDPLVGLQIGNQHIQISLSNHLRQIVQLYPEYNYNLPRLIKYINSQKPGVKVIDIGANVGDTVAFIKNYTDVPILCIDGEEKYLKILEKNIAPYNNVSVCKALVGAENTETNLSLKAERGTAFLAESSTVTHIRTLENILEEFPNFKDSKVLKSDTDGFDTIILRSCSNYLKNNHPVLFLEFDPFLIVRNNDDPFSFISYLGDCGYQYFMFYENIGDFILACNLQQTDTINQLIQYFSGRKMERFMDIAVFAKEDKDLFDYCTQAEMAHFKQIRAF